MKLQFLGAAGTVTGSRYLLQTGGKRLLVDCGLFQGVKVIRQRNWQPPGVAAASIDAVVLTHAHIDHSGYLPVLVKQGFAGKIHCTSATRDLCEILLRDAAHLQEEDARHANKHGYSKHKPALPLFTLGDAERALDHFTTSDFDCPIDLGGVHLRFTGAGHIMGAASVTLWDHERSILFSGDLGRPHDALMLAPSTNRGADFVVVESTYGDRRHRNVDAKSQLTHVINETAARSGVVIIPAFAVGRAQSLLFYIQELKRERRIADVPVFLNSPMAASVLGLFSEHLGQHRLSASQCDAMAAAAHIVTSVDESKALNRRKGPMIIIAGSGMATGGRVVHHLEAFCGDPANTILLAGYQTPGTRGALLLSGPDDITIHGRDLPLRAQVEQMAQLSAHADYVEILAWLGNFAKAPKMTFITHGEPAAADGLRHRIERSLHWACTVPAQEEQFELS